MKIDDGATYRTRDGRMVERKETRMRANPIVFNMLLAITQEDDEDLQVAFSSDPYHVINYGLARPETAEMTWAGDDGWVPTDPKTLTDIDCVCNALFEDGVEEACQQLGLDELDPGIYAVRAELRFFSTHTPGLGEDHYSELSTVLILPIWTGRIADVTSYLSSCDNRRPE
jgi:hypothetical protein